MEWDDTITAPPLLGGEGVDSDDTSSNGAFPVGEFSLMTTSTSLVSTVTWIPLYSAAINGAKARKAPGGEYKVYEGGITLVVHDPFQWMESGKQRESFGVVNATVMSLPCAV